MKIKKYRKKPVIIEAVIWDGSSACAEFLSGWTNKTLRLTSSNRLIIPTLEGDHYANEGDIIIKGVADEFYPCKPDIFEQTYEEVLDGQKSSNRYPKIRRS